MLTGNEQIIQYLLRQELIEGQDIVDHELIIADCSRRNCNFKVITNTGTGYFVKQHGGNGRKKGSALASLAHEAKIYSLLNRPDRHTRFKYYLPKFILFDQRENLLVLEHLSAYTSIGEYYLRHNSIPRKVAPKIGTALAELHRIGIPAATSWLSSTESIPWILFLPEPDQWVLFNASAACLQLLKIIQQSPEICDGFRQLKSGWRQETLIHGDFKWDNCLLPFQQDTKTTASLKIVDWELAAIGDPCWDVATILGEYLHAWLSSIPISAQTAPDSFLPLATYPLEKMHLSTKAFMQAYQQHNPAENTRAQEKLLRTIQYTGARLVQIAFEQCQGAATINNDSIYLLQLAANIMVRPELAAVQIFGFTLKPAVYETAILS